MKIFSGLRNLRTIMLCTVFALNAGTAASTGVNPYESQPGGPFIATRILNYNPNVKAIFAYTAFGASCTPLATGTSVRGPLLTIHIWDHDEFHAMSNIYCAAGSEIQSFTPLSAAYDHLVQNLYLVVGGSDMRLLIKQQPTQH
ncbi:hypothetical protein XACN24_05950 [Xanthomonas albilineans]|uniref:hypothetical protein n=1 Tax=Xanthomonas albilineans TaxID=29447 RepID=UPI000A9C85E1|nr:hypothetical protein [Xanthomonas albilineans]